jgi:AcrR family transcriptional regulator
MPRETILGHAARLFAEQGYERTSLQDVARAVGLSKAAIYHYYPTKQVIYEAIVTDLLVNLTIHVRVRVEAEVEHRERLRAFMESHAEYFEQNHSAFVTLLHGVSGIGRPQTPGQIAVRDEYEDLLRSLLAEGKAAGAFVVEDTHVCARAVLSMLNWMSRWFQPDGPKRAKSFASEFFEMFYRGLAPPPGRP